MRRRPQLLRSCRWPAYLAALLPGLLLFLLAAGPSSARAGEDISPPFGLQWDQPSMQIEKLLTGAKAQITQRRDIEGREAWTVEGLLQVNLKRAMFYFHRGGLVEVELQYQNDAWTSMKYSDFMSQVRRKIEQRYGTGKLIARQRAAESGVMQTVVGYKWNQNNTSIQLFYYSAEASAFTFRTVSVHYKLLAVGAQ